MCDCFYFLGQTGSGDFVDTIVFMHSLSILLGSDPDCLLVSELSVFFFFFFFFFFCVPQLYLWGSPLLGEIFAYVTVFFNPTIKVVTFRLRGWCVLGVFLLPAFTRLGHERTESVR